VVQAARNGEVGSDSVLFAAVRRHVAEQRRLIASR
jgi:hypothetical protein